MTLNEAAAIRASDVLTVPQLIRLHGDVTAKLANKRQTLDALRTMRMGITEEEGIGELMLQEAIREYDEILDTLSRMLGYAQ